MCGGMKYRYTDPETGEVTERKVYFPRPKALIPVIDDGSESLCQWGRRDEKEDPESGVPMGGWARLESLEKDYWKRFEPEKVLIPALEYCEKPSGFDKSVWFPALAPRVFLLGLKVERAGKGFVYVVTCSPKHVYFGDIDRLPVLAGSDLSVVEHQEPYFQSEEQLGLF